MILDPTSWCNTILLSRSSRGYRGGQLYRNRLYRFVGLSFFDGNRGGPPRIRIFLVTQVQSECSSGIKTQGVADRFIAAVVLFGRGKYNLGGFHHFVKDTCTVWFRWWRWRRRRRCCQVGRWWFVASSIVVCVVRRTRVIWSRHGRGIVGGRWVWRTGRLRNHHSESGRFLLVGIDRAWLGTGRRRTQTDARPGFVRAFC